MKKISLFIIPILILCFILAACNGNNKPTEENTGEPENPAEISEKAMDSFLAKLSEGNYTMDAPEYCKISVQPDEVIFDYADNMYDDFAVVSIDNESFQGFLTGSQMSEVLRSDCRQRCSAKKFPRATSITSSTTQKKTR